MERLREHGSHYKNKLVDGGAGYLKPIQDKFNNHLNSQQYNQKIKTAYNNVAANVDTFRGKADTVIKQVRRDPKKYMVDTGRQVVGYMQDTGQKVGDSLQEAGRQSVDKIQEVHKDTKNLIYDMRENPDKYTDKAKQQYRESYNKLGQEANKAYNRLFS